MTIVKATREKTDNALLFAPIDVTERRPSATRSTSQRRERTLALVALCVGGMVVARCVDDPDLADDVRRAVIDGEFAPELKSKFG